jgi:hypothetical protein
MNQYYCVALQTLDNTEGTIKNRQSRGIFNFGHTRHRIKTKKTQLYKDEQHGLHQK